MALSFSSACRGACVSSVVAVLAGCSANVVASAEAADAESSPAAAVIVVERTSGDSPRGEAVARFVRGRSGPLDEQALRWLGLQPELPTLGACARTSTDVPSMPQGGLRLLDVGRVTLTADINGRETQSAELVRRRVPDVADVVSGVVYTASDLELPARGSFEVRVVGEPELTAVPTAVRTEIVFAGEPANVRVQTQDATSGAVLVSLETPIEVTWDAPERSDDLVYIDVTVTENTSSRKAVVTRCAFTDSGRGSVPASAFGEADGSLTVHRMRRESFRSTGVDRGELRLDFAREIAFGVRSRR